jgi:hypothetical protein
MSPEMRAPCSRTPQLPDILAIPDEKVGDDLRPDGSLPITLEAATVHGDSTRGRMPERGLTLAH